MMSSHETSPRSLKRWITALILLGVASRVAWVLWIHPPTDHIRSDMSAYVGQARSIAEHGRVLDALMPAFRPFGTGWILGSILRISGSPSLQFAAIVQAIVAGLAPALTTLLGWTVTGRARASIAAGVATLLWFPALSLNGYFLSEPWYGSLVLGTTWLLARAINGQSGALLGGLLGALAFWVRPEVIALYGLCAVAVLLGRQTLTSGSLRRGLTFALPLLLGVGVSVSRHHDITGEWRLTPNSGALNLTMGRCHLTRLEAYPSTELKRLADKGGPKRGWWIDLPGYRQLSDRRGADHILSVHPSLGLDHASYVGRISDPVALAALRRRCIDNDSVPEQVRKSVVNAHLLWAMETPWPETDQERGRLRSLAQVHLWLAILVWFMAIPEAVRSIRTARDAPAKAIPAIAVSTILLLAAVVFGTPRLRTPYDPFAFILAASGAARWLTRLADRRATTVHQDIKPAHAAGRDRPT